MDASETLHRYLVETVRFKSRLGLTFPPGYHYQGGEDYVLDRGSPMTSAPLTAQERVLVLRAVDRSPERQFRVGHCYYNAQVLVAHDTSGTLQYYEGWAMGLLGIPTLHSWATIRSKVIDLTWRTPKPMSKGRLGSRIWGQFPAPWAYYGASFGRDAVIARMVRLGVTGPFLDDVAHGFPLFQEPRLGDLKEPV